MAKTRQKTVEFTAGKILLTADEGLTLIETKKVGLDDFLDDITDISLRPPVTDLLFNYFRNKPLIDLSIKETVTSKIKPRYRRIIALVLTQSWFQTGIAQASAVNIAVATSKNRFGIQPAGFINAVLRNILLLGSKHFESRLSLLEKLSIPELIGQRWLSRWGEQQTVEISSLIKSPALFTFRAKYPLTLEELNEVNASRIMNQDLSGHWNFYSTTDLDKLFRTDWLEKGKIYIQDPATTVAVDLPEISGGESVIDLCAAPGGKFILLSERLISPGRMVAADKSARRQILTAENFYRHNIHAEIISCEVNNLPFGDNSFDIVIADVPCSNTGVFRRRPDALWRFCRDSFNEIIKIQSDILSAAARLVKTPRGQLVYSTCSIEMEENENQVLEFCNKFPNFKIKFMRTILPSIHHDGGFAALLIKQ
jgi:16S rRNA (cytosine967-C5)-methyltransferase